MSQTVLPRSRAEVSYTIEQSASEDITVRKLREQTNRGHLAALPLFIGQAKKRAAQPETDQRLSTVLLCEAAAAARLLGELDKASELLLSAHAGLPAFSLDLLAQIKRLEARILLDKGNSVGARQLADQIDAYEFTRARGAEPLIIREEADVSADTWALIAEIALLEGKPRLAGQSLERGLTKLARDEEARIKSLGDGGIALAAYDSEFKRKEQEAADTRDYLRFLEAVWCVRIGNPEGRNQLEEIREKSVGNAPLLARVRAALGEWNEQEESMPPAGINLFEARRWHLLGTSPPEAEIDEEVTEEFHTVSANKVEPETSLTNELTASTGENAVTLLYKVLSKLLREQEERDAGRQDAKPQATAASTTFDEDFTIAGKFRDFDITAMIKDAENGKMTGYFKSLWSVAPLEEMIKTGYLHEGARSGCGYFFLRDGLLVDATLGTEKVAEDMSALEALTVLVQIGLGLIPEAEGQARGYKDSSVAARPSRLEIDSNDRLIMDLMRVLDEKNRDGGTGEEEKRVTEERSQLAAPVSATSHEILVLEDGDLDEAFAALEASASSGPAIPASLLAALVEAIDQHALAKSLKNILESLSGGAGMVRIFGGVQARSQSGTWAASESNEAQKFERRIDVGGGLVIEVTTTRPLDENLIQTLLETAALRLRVMPRTQKGSSPSCLTTSAGAGTVVHSAKMRSVYDRVTTLASQDGLQGRALAHILIVGETGSGKELVARRIHELSGRAGGPWKSINLAGMPKDLIRSAIFGHVKGAFTGATAEQSSLFEQTEGGTLLIDEFGELDLNTQAMVLRVLEEFEYNRIGETREPRKLSSRIIFATNRQVDDETIFRADIKFRCKVVRIPALREHPEDIRPMAIHFAESRGVKILEAALLWCESKTWPGNVRELKSVIEEAAEIARDQGGEINLDDVVEATVQYETQMSVRGKNDDTALIRPGENMSEALMRIERELLQKSLNEAGKGRGRLTRAAQIFGVSRQNFSNALKRHELLDEGD